jgi:hypothetical protein
MQKAHPKFLVRWGKHGLSFDLGEPERYQKEVPDAGIHLLDAGYLPSMQRRMRLLNSPTGSAKPKIDQPLAHEEFDPSLRFLRVVATAIAVIQFGAIACEY